MPVTFVVIALPAFHFPRIKMSRAYDSKCI